MVRAAAAAGLLALTPLTGACATFAAKDTSFGPESPQSMLIVVNPKSSEPRSASFRRVNLDEWKFEREVATASAAGWFGQEINQTGDVHFTAKLVMPGDYAIVQLFLARGGAQIWSCMANASPVFTLRPGQITIVRVGPYWAESPYATGAPLISDEAVLKQFEAARGYFADLRGEPTVAEPAAVLRWANGGIGWTRNCSESSTFTRLD